MNGATGGEWLPTQSISDRPPPADLTYSLARCHSASLAGRSELALLAGGRTLSVACRRRLGRRAARRGLAGDGSSRWRCTPVDDADLLNRFADLASQQCLSRPPPLMRADGIVSPLLLGVRRPAVVLPASLPARCPPGELRLMLAHELAHLRRRDLLWNVLPAAAQAVFWFHPFVWLARREWRLAQEVACDEAAVAATGSRPADYARGPLLGVVQQCAWNCPPPAAARGGRRLQKRSNPRAGGSSP